MSRPSQFDLGIDHSGQVPPTSRLRRRASGMLQLTLVAAASMLAGIYIFPL